jgi:hypothetical protein
MKLFEYKQITKMDYINQSLLSQMGKEGWELILCDVGSYIFKREMEPLPEQIEDNEFDDYGMRNKK